MHLITAIVALTLTCLYAFRVGNLLPETAKYDSAAFLSGGLSLAVVTAGLFERNRLGSEFLWFHWLLLAALVALATSLAAGIAVQATRRKDR